MMVPPGWNVTEPLGLAVTLYRVIDSLKAAPDDAKAFTAKIESFRRDLEGLDRVFKRSLELEPNADHFDLRKALADCQVCVQRCQKFQESFQRITRDGSANIANASELARWVWKDKQIIKLRHEIDSQMSSVNFKLNIKSL